MKFQKPPTIPFDPGSVTSYAEWRGWGDWLGHNRIYKGSWRKFEDARTFVHSLRFTNVEQWREFSKTSARPQDIPSAPERAYLGKGWTSFRDWIGISTYNNNNKPKRSFVEARIFARSLGLKTQKDWARYVASGKKPVDIPSTPNIAYRDEWKNLADWLGTKECRRGEQQWMPFEEARSFVRSLDLKDFKGWHAYLKSNSKPDNIPADPRKVYKDFTTLADWLGGSNRHRDAYEFYSYQDAKSFVAGLNIRTGKQYVIWAKSKKRPSFIPASPAGVYAEEWKGWGDYLGTGSISNEFKSQFFLPFEEAKKEISSLGIESFAKWRAYWRENKRPSNIPANPLQVYKGKGWIGWGDWLGTDKKAGQKHEVLSS